MGLQRADTYSLEFNAVEPYTVAFCIEFRDHLQDAGRVPEKIRKDRLDLITRTARDHARGLVHGAYRKREREEDGEEWVFLGGPAKKRQDSRHGRDADYA